MESRLSGSVFLIIAVIRVVDGSAVIVLPYFLESYFLYTALWRLRVEFCNGIEGITGFRTVESISLRSLSSSLSEYFDVLDKAIIRGVDYSIGLPGLSRSRIVRSELSWSVSVDEVISEVVKGGAACFIDLSLCFFESYFFLNDFSSNRCP